MLLKDLKGTSPHCQKSLGKWHFIIKKYATENIVRYNENVYNVYHSLKEGFLKSINKSGKSKKSLLNKLFDINKKYNADEIIYIIIQIFIESARCTLAKNLAQTW